MQGTLYLVATPIGDPEDITLRAVRILKTADVVVCEEHREGKRLLRHLGIETPTEELNEHNEDEGTAAILGRLQEGKHVAVISDAGTPVFSDPGRSLVRGALRNGIRVVPVPGPSSLMPALIVSGFPIRQFVFRGFLSPKREERVKELKELKKDRRTIVLMDTPYRLRQLVRDIADTFGDTRALCVALDLTLPTEEVMHGPASGILRSIGEKGEKREFVLLIEGQE